MTVIKFRICSVCVSVCLYAHGCACKISIIAKKWVASTKFRKVSHCMLLVSTKFLNF
jgi:hypothetical protein